MKKITILLILGMFLSSCGSDRGLTEQTLLDAYDTRERSIDLYDSGITGFVNLNDIKPDVEVGNLYLSENSIEVLNISEYENLGKLELQNNNITFFGDVKYPKKLRQLDLSFNNLQNLDGIEELTELQTLNLSFNKLDEDDFKALAGLDKLRLVYVDGNDVSLEFIEKITNFNFQYLSRIKK